MRKKKIRDLLRRDTAPKVSLETPQNEYYEAISVRFGMIQVVLYMALFAFVVLSFFRNTNLITYQNFYYFFKDLNASAETVDLFATDSVTYPTDAQQSFSLYRNGLAVAGNSSVTVFSATGRQTVSRNVEHYQNPVAVGTGKYLLVYELGGTRYSIYNFYTQLHTADTKTPISCAVASECGMYAVVSSLDTHTSVVSLYNDRFELVTRYEKSGYVMDVDIDAKGERIAILTSDTKNGLFDTRLEIYKPGKTEAVATVNIGDGIGLDCVFTDASNVSVLCSDQAVYVSSTGEMITSHTLDGDALRCMDSGRAGLTLCLDGETVADSNTVLAFDKNGKIVYNKTVTEQARQITRNGDCVYVLHSEGIRRISLANGEGTVLPCDTEGRVILAVGDKEVLLCSPQKALYLRFES